MHNSYHHNPPVHNGVVLVAGGAIGAGMFSLPIVSTGMWFGWALICLLVVWLITLLASLLILEANLLYPRGASFASMVKGSLGKSWSRANNLAIMFVMYILLYAFFSASGSIAEQTSSSLTNTQNPLPQSLSGLIIGFIIALLVWSGASAVSRISSILMLAMLLTFGLSSAGLLLNINLASLFIWGDSNGSYMPFIWVALPYFVTSFACAGIIPSLVKYYEHRHDKVRSSLIYGTLLALLIYLLWVAATFSGLSRESLTPVIQAGGNIGQLVEALQQNGASARLQTVINLFSNFAIITSFLSIALGLFDFLADRFRFGEGSLDRLKSAALTFTPPGLLSFFFPDGFILAIGYAGFFVLFSFFIVPAAMAFKHRSNGNAQFEYKVSGGNLTLYVVLLFATIVGLLKILGTFKLLPFFG
jgi:tryptophan-specific transport protein